MALHFSLLPKRLFSTTKMVNKVAIVNCPHLRMNVGVAKAPIVTVTNTPRRSFVPTRMLMVLPNVLRECTRNILMPFMHIVKAGYPRTK